MADTNGYSDATWRQALNWIIREHESSFDDMTRAMLHQWLADSVANQKAYQEARTLWMIMGLIPADDE